MIWLEKKAIEIHNLNVEKSTDLKQLSGVYDVITMWQCFRAYYRIKCTVSEFKRLLSESGKIILYSIEEF